MSMLNCSHSYDVCLSHAKIYTVGYCCFVVVVLVKLCNFLYQLWE